MADRQAPKMRAPASTAAGLPRASMASTMPMKPAPLVMKGTKMPAPTSAMKAPPRPASRPVVSTAPERIAATDTPAASSAAGLSPAAWSASPRW